MSGSAIIRSQRLLRERLGLHEDRMLLSFEALCDSLRDRVEKIEWTCLWTPGIYVDNRFNVCFSAPGDQQSPTAILQMFEALGVNHRHLSMPDELWSKLTSGINQRLFVGYAGSRLGSIPNPLLKITLPVNNYTQEVHEHLRRMWLPKLPAEMPPPTTNIMITFATDGNGHCAPSLYLFYHSSDYDDNATYEYMTALVGASVVRFLSSHSDSCISFKGIGTDRVYVPIDDLDAPFRTLVKVLSSGHTVLPDYADRVIGIGIPTSDVFREYITEIELIIKLPRS